MNSAPKPSPTIPTLTLSVICSSGSGSLPQLQSPNPWSGAWSSTSPPPLRRADVKYAVHDAPVPGERAHVGIVALFRRGLELDGQGFSRFHQLRREQDLRNLGDVLLRRAVRRARELVGGGANRVQRA